MKRFWTGVLILIVVCLAGFAAYAWKPAIDPIEPPQRASFDHALIVKGAVVASVGNCTACHTKPGGKSFAGGLAVPTPFGTIYSTNITPDPKTGIGRWSEAAFSRAMREGVERDGDHLYPAFPFDHFTLVSDEDNKALYAYLMTRHAVENRPPANELPFPLNLRFVLAGWKLLFFDKGAYREDASQSAEWNRGAYLVEGLGHCGACHTPRNLLGAERKGAHLAGGEAEGWDAFALDRSSSAPIPWTHDSLFAYLRQGWHADHGVANGPMAEVTGNLGRLPDTDISAIATYLVSQMGEPAPERAAAAEDIRKKLSIDQGGTPIPASATTGSPTSRGGAIYQAACATCHDGSRPQPFGGIDFHLSSTIAARDPQNAINVVLFGLPAASGRESPIMPGFAATLTDDQVADLLGYLREAYAQKPAWADAKAKTADTRSGKYRVSVRPSDGIERSPDNVGAKD
ncbi:c-type cytochrome [Mesorhizobium sp. B2-8-5]|uniref:c-type cytochrome n=1 Tax=Mesorhizobium sp. B2-8-5 TaxID=2589903 RepID=UPI00112DEC87|nr:cytochrome c [Mesorhizobium sp. B2-8-5]UCI24700.1 cytochrome c [Mesorhizobium sp. B2-8-5]